MNSLIVFIILISALMLDHLLGETKRYHPLVGFGNCAKFIEAQCRKRVNRLNFKQQKINQQKALGIFAWCLLVLPLPVIYFYLHQSHWFFYCIDSLVVYFAIGLNSLKQHAGNILQPLAAGDIQHARKQVGMIVSRNTEQLTEAEISRATVESVLENGHDAVLASLFWFCIGGAPLVIVHRLANTLDAMWGYKNQRYIHFGWCAAKMDDWIGWPSAKISALLYVLVNTQNINSIKETLVTTYKQANQYKSLNGGWVMAAGALVLKLKLGGKGIYHNKIIETETWGDIHGNDISPESISPSLKLVQNASILFVCLIGLSGLLFLVFGLIKGAI